MAKKTLLQKAKEVRAKSKRYSSIYDPQEIQELSLAWVRDEIGLGHIAKALGLPNTGYRTYAKIALSLKSYINENNKSVPSNQ